MNFFKSHLQRISNQDLILCAPSLKIKDLPKLEEVILNANFERNLGSTLCLLQLLGLNTPAFTRNKNGNLSLNLKKGEVVGCKLSLKKKFMYAFLENFTLDIHPNLKKFKPIKLDHKALHFFFKDVYNNYDLNNHISYLYGQNNLNIVVKFKNLNHNLNKSFLNSLRLNYKN